MRPEVKPARFRRYFKVGKGRETVMESQLEASLLKIPITILISEVCSEKTHLFDLLLNLL